jgi:hypothetical protein
MMSIITRSGTLPDSAGKADFYALVDSATVGTILNADVDASAAIAASKIAGNAQGDIPYADGTPSSLALLAAGTAGLFLMTGGAGANPSWASPTGYKVGTFSIDTTTATGTQAITGVGFTPKAVVFFAVQSNSVEVSFGFDDGTDARAISYNPDVSVWGNSATFSIYDVNGTGSSYGGNVDSFDEDGFTIGWTKEGSPTGTLTVYYLALK